MSSLFNKRILLGVSGGIAAYKSAEIVRRLQDHGAEVRVIMTPAAQEFITPLTLQALSGNPVHTELLDTQAEAAMGHIELARWADLLLIAPASADLLARMASGLGNDLLTTVVLAARSPIVLAPAMNQAMYHNASVQENLQTLNSRGATLLGPAAGSQACGDVGLGRMLEADEIVAACGDLFISGSLSGQKVVITAGPTQEAIDPVRYISNHSSGKMGYALAQAAIEAGAKTILISGPCHLTPPEEATCVHVTTALEMHDASMTHGANCDIFIAAAAVADFRPEQTANQKIKKTGDESMTITFVKNPDIVADIAASKPKPYTVAFAAESQKVEEYARKKLNNKKVDCIIANDISLPNIGFNSDNNAVTLIDKKQEIVLPESNKQQLARDIIALLAQKKGA